MKYTLLRDKENDTVKLTLEFEQENELVFFHDNVMAEITKTEIHRFHGDIYKIIRRRISSARGKINIKCT